MGRIRASSHITISDEDMLRLGDSPRQTFVKVGNESERNFAIISTEEGINAWENFVADPSKLSKHSMPINFATVIPLIHLDTPIGWYIKCPNMDIHSNERYICIRRKNAPDLKNLPQVKASLKGLMVLDVQDHSTLLLSTKATDFRT